MKLKFLVLAVLIISAPVSAGNGEILTLDRCTGIALKNNPLIQSYNHQYRAAIARTRQAKAIPDPEISLDFDLQPKLFDFPGAGESYVGVSQLIEFPGRRYLRGKIAGKEADEFFCDFQSARLDLLYRVKKAFYELLLTKEEKQYAAENLTHAKDFLNKAREKYESGDVSKLEVLRARVEAARAENRKKITLTKIKLAKSSLNFVLAREKHRPIEIRGSLKRPFPALDLEKLTARALQERAEIKKVNFALQKEKLNRTQAYLSYLPDFSLGLSRHRITAEPTTWDVTLSFQVPLLFWQKERGEIAEARANVASQKAGLKYIGLAIALEVENAFHNAVSFRSQIEFLEKEVLHEAEEVYRMSSISYKEGKIGSIELITSRKTLLEIKQSYAETLLNYRLALAELEKSVGAPVEGEKK